MSNLCEYKACCRLMRDHEGNHDYAPDTEYDLLREQLKRVREWAELNKLDVDNKGHATDLAFGAEDLLTILDQPEEKP